MNEKIEELYAEAKQATKIGRMNAPSGVVAKKFAELIVKECAEWIKNTDSDPDIGEEDAKALLEHFGVEE